LPSKAVEQPEAGRSRYAVRLPLWVLVGAVLGVAVGLFFGEGATVLRPIGNTYVKLMEVVVFPYIICSLLHGLGRLQPAMAWRLFRCSWHIYALVWGITFAIIFLLSFAIPPAPPPSFIDASVPAKGLGLLDLLIPANPFLDLVNNHLPAIVIFSIVYGIAIQRVKDKEAFLSFLDLIRKASVTIWQWVVLLAPFGVFALFADTTGNVEPKALADLTLYLLAVLTGTFVLAFWILPAVVAALCPMTAREILRDLQGAFVIAMVTTLSVAALPYIQQAAEKFARRAGVDDGDSSEIIKTTLAVSYPLAQLGNFFIWLFMLFAAFYFRIPLTWGDGLALPAISLLSGFGSPSSSVDAVAFLTDWLTFPDGATDLYVEMMTLTRYGQVAASVMGFAFVTFLVTLSYYGKLHYQLSRKVVPLLCGVVFLVVVSVAGRGLQSEVTAQELEGYKALRLAADTADVKVTIEKPAAEKAAAAQSAGAAPAEPIMQRVRRSGELKVGFNPNIIPFSYRNDQGELVGFDVAYAFRLAKDLGVDLRFIPFSWNGLEKDLEARRFDLALAGIYVTDERLQHFAVSEPYRQSPVALIVNVKVVRQFLDRSEIDARPNLAVGIFDDPVMIALANRLFPGAKQVVLPSYDVLPQHPEVDAAIWTLEQAKAWAAPLPDYAAVVPKGLGGHFLIAYLMPEDALNFRVYLDYWLRLQEVNGFKDRMVRKWIDGTPEKEEAPRWSILHNVLGWSP